MRISTSINRYMCLCILALCSGLSAKVGVIVNKDLYPLIRNAVLTYVNDVRTIDGKVVWVDTTTFDSGNGRTNLQHW